MKSLSYYVAFLILINCGCDYQSAKEKDLEQRINQLEQKVQQPQNIYPQESPPQPKKINLQMTVAEMIRIYNMTDKQFSKYATSKGLDLLNDGKYEEGLEYGIATEGIFLCSGCSGGALTYQTSERMDYLRLKNQFKKNGFVYCDGYTSDEIEEPKTEQQKVNLWSDTHRISIDVIDNVGGKCYLFVLRMR